MTDRIEPSFLLTPTPAPDPASSPSTAPAGGDFRDALRDAARRLAAGEAAIDGVVARLGRGRTPSPEELIALQHTVYRHAQEVEMAAKLVDKLTSAVKTTLTSQS